MRRLLTIALLAPLAVVACAEPAGVTPRGPRFAPGHLMAVILDPTGHVVGPLRGDGSITDAVPDGRGGWYVQGSFHVLQHAARPGLARIDQNGRVERAWRPAAPAQDLRLGAASNSEVYLAAHSDDAGTYRLEVLSARTGRRLASRVMAGSGQTMAATAGRLFVAGAPPITSCIDAYTPLGRSLYRFAVHMLAEAACVNALAIAGEKLYAAGSLGLEGETPGAAVARFDLRTGRPDTGWQAQPRPCRTCYGLAYGVAIGDGRVFVNPGAGNQQVSALSAATGAQIRAWRPRVLGGSTEPAALSLAGSTLFVLTGHGLLAFDARTGAALRSWQPPAGASETPPVASGARVLVAFDAPAP